MFGTETITLAAPTLAEAREMAAHATNCPVRVVFDAAWFTAADGVAKTRAYQASRRHQDRCPVCVSEDQEAAEQARAEWEAEKAVERWYEERGAWDVEDDSRWF